LQGFHGQALTLQGKFEIQKSLKVIKCSLGSPSKSSLTHPHRVASLAQPFGIKLKLHSCSGPRGVQPTRRVQPMRRSGAHKSLGDPWTSMLKMETGNHAQNFYCC